jgi:uncharacterized membrane protein YqiK
VQAIDTLIGDINPPAQLMQTQTDRKIAEEQRKTYEVQEAAQSSGSSSCADGAGGHPATGRGREQGVNIAELKANASVKRRRARRSPSAARAGRGGGDPRHRPGEGRGVSRGRGGARRAELHGHATDAE